MSVIVYGWPPMFGTLGPSPYPLKTEVQLQLLGVEYACAIANLDSVSKHKAPYVDDGGVIIQDSTFIRWYFEMKAGRSLDADLSPSERAAAWGLERMLEDRLAHIMAIERWLEGDNFERGPAQFFQGAPEPMRSSLIKDVRDSLRMAHQRVGLMRHSREERLMLAECDIAAISAHLGDKAFMFGDRPSALDGAAFGVLEAVRAPVFDTPLIGFVEKAGNLAPYLERMQARFFAAPKWRVAA